MPTRYEQRCSLLKISHIYRGGNKGKDQIYAKETKNNNTVYNTISADIVSRIVCKEECCLRE